MSRPIYSIDVPDEYAPVVCFALREKANVFYGALARNADAKNETLEAWRMRAEWLEATARHLADLQKQAAR